MVRRPSSKSVIPTVVDAARILAAPIADIPGGEAVDTAAVAAALPHNISGSESPAAMYL